MSALLTYTLLGTPETPSTPHLVARIANVLLPDIQTAVDLTPGEHDGFWSPAVPVPFSVERSLHDFRDLPYADLSFDVAFFDAPHMAVRSGELLDLIQDGAAEAWRVSRIGLVAKVCEHVHDELFQAEPSWVEAVLGEPYQRVHVVRKKPAGYHPPPQRSAYSNGAVWLIYRRGCRRHVSRGWQLGSPMR